MDYPCPPLPRASVPRLDAPARCRYDQTRGRPDPDHVRATAWTRLAWLAAASDCPTLAARYSAFAYALGADEMNLKIIAGMVRAVVSGMEPGQIGKMVEDQVKRQGGDPRVFWKVVLEVANARTDAWRRWDAQKAQERAAAPNVVDVGPDQ